MVRKLLILAVAAAAIGLGVFWIVTIPATISASALAHRAPNLETPLHYFQLDFTPNDVFFVRWHLANLPTQVDADTFRLRVRGAREITLLVGAATSYVRHGDIGGDPVRIVRGHTDAAARKPYAALRADHVQAHQEPFRRLSLRIGTDDGALQPMQPTDARIRARGAEYHAAGAVIHFDPQPTFAYAVVRGSDDYVVRLDVANRIVRGTCTCPHFTDHLEPCKHLWAVVLQRVISFITSCPKLALGSMWWKRAT